MKLFSFSKFRWSLSGSVVAWLGVAVLSGLAGCASAGGEYTYVTRISTGERMKFPLTYGRPELATSGTIKIRAAGLSRPPGEGVKKVTYDFVFEDKSGAVPKAVKIEDVSEKTPLPILEDLNPKLKDNFWTGTSKAMDADDPLLSWVPYLDNSFRVFRFTITAADGHETVLYQGWSVPGFVKAGVRMALGLKA